MGHKVNPLIFRLGVSNNWESSFKEPKNWVTSYLVYQLVYNQFMRYTIPHFNKKVKRNTRNVQGLVRMKGEKQIIQNPLTRRSILFSHLNSGSRNSEISITCYFYDHGVHYKSYKFREKKFVRYSQLFSNSPLKKYIRHPFWRKQIKHRNYPWIFRRWIKKLGPQLWLYNFRIRNFIAKPMNSFKLNLCWLRLSSKLTYFNSAKKIFFINVWLNLLTGIFSILKSTGNKSITRRIYLMIQLLNFVNYSLKVQNFKFFSKLFVYRYYLFKAVSRTINGSIRSLIPGVTKVRTAFHALKEKQMRSSLMTNLIIVKLGQYYTINSIIFPVAKWLKRHKNVLGFRIIVSGRLTRRERASHIVQSYKKMPLSSYKHTIDYHQDIKIMKFGMVGIKVYLFLRKKIRHNYYWVKFLHNQ